MWIRRFGIVGAVAGLVALVGCDPAGQGGKTSGADQQPDGSGSAKVADGPDAGGEAADPLPTAPFEPAEAPEPTKRLEEAPSADKLSGMVESYFQDKPGRRIYIQTDKPLYRPGETIWVKSWNLTARDLTGVSDNNGVVYRLISPKGDVVEIYIENISGNLAFSRRTN